MKRELNKADEEVSAKIKELQLFVNAKLSGNELSDNGYGQRLINDVQLLRHIWTKTRNSM